MKASVKWIKENQLEGFTKSGVRVPMDAPEKSEGRTGASPSELILQALGGCTMMDIVSIVTKSRKTIKDFKIEIDSETAPDYPKVYTKIHLKYIISGEGITNELMERAI